MAELTETQKQNKHKVSVSLGYTRNMGNFESLRLDIGLEAEGAGHPDVTFDRVYGWVQEKLTTKMTELDAELASEDDKDE